MQNFRLLFGKLFKFNCTMISLVFKKIAVTELLWSKVQNTYISLIFIKTDCQELAYKVSDFTNKTEKMSIFEAL